VEVHLGTSPNVDPSVATAGASRLLGQRVEFVRPETDPDLDGLDREPGLRAIRDTGIVGASDLTDDERLLVSKAFGSGRPASRPLLDARSIQGALWRLSSGRPAVIALPLMMVSWHRYDARYHARVMVAGYPSVISLPGLVEAPAKPKEYYVMQSRGVPAADLDAVFKGRFLAHDSDLTPFLGVYLAAAGAYYLLGSPFCDFHGCALYDNHWQKELLEAPRRPLCERHRRKIEAMP
jgi:hypothetical protein